MGLFNNNNNAAAGNPLTRASCEAKYNIARTNLLMLFIFSVVNILLIFTNWGFYMLWSASVPYLLVSLMWDLCGHLPAEAYADLVDIEFLPNGLLYAAIVIAAVILLFYLMAFLFSKNGRYGWMIAALVLFSIDCLALIFGLISGFFAGNVIFDLLFHAWMMYYLISAVVNGSKMKRLPSAAVEYEAAYTPVEVPTEVPTELPSEDPAQPTAEEPAEAPAEAESKDEESK